MSELASSTPLALLGLGFVLGLRHALDVDHLAAVSTIVSQGRGLLRSAGGSSGRWRTARACTFTRTSTTASATSTRTCTREPRIRTTGPTAARS